MTEEEIVKRMRHLLVSFENQYQENPHNFDFFDAMTVIYECLKLLNQEESL